MGRGVPVSLCLPRAIILFRVVVVCQVIHPHIFLLLVVGEESHQSIRIPNDSDATILAIPLVVVLGSLPPGMVFALPDAAAITAVIAAVLLRLPASRHPVFTPREGRGRARQEMRQDGEPLPLALPCGSLRGAPGRDLVLVFTGRRRNPVVCVTESFGHVNVLSLEFSQEQ